jgi:hypothetical protein
MRNIKAVRRNGVADGPDKVSSARCLTKPLW